MDPAARAELAGRLQAWWDGRDFVPPVPGDASSEVAETPAAQTSAAQAPAAPAPIEEPEPPAPKRRSRDRSEPAEPNEGGLSPRMRALESLWGEGRAGPGSTALDTLLLDEAFATADSSGAIGFIGADAALVQAAGARSNRALVAADWREACAARTRQMAAAVTVEVGEPDRPRGFPQAGLAAIISVDAFAYSDHKAGLIARAYKALSETGRWVILDTTRASPKTPPGAFASAWAEPQPGGREDLEEALRVAGFHRVRYLEVAELVRQAARDGFERLGGELEGVVKSGTSGRSGALFLQELAWEAASWRARIRALDGGALAVGLWIAEKGEAEGPQAAPPPKTAVAKPVAPKPAAKKAEPKPAPEPETPAEEESPLDQSSIDSLFD